MKAVFVLAKVPFPASFRDIGEPIEWIDRATGKVDRLAMRVGRKDLDLEIQLQFMHQLVDHHRDRIGLFASGCRSNPNSETSPLPCCV